MDDFKGADPHDYAIGQKSPEEIGYPFLRGGQALSPEGSTFEDAKISEYEDKNGLPYLAVKLGYGEKFNLDPAIEMKVRAVDEHIRQIMQEKGMKDTPFTYQSILAQMGGKLAESFESAKNHNTTKSLLENLFMQVSFANKLSSQTYFKEYSRRFNEQRISKSLSELKNALNTINKLYVS